MTWWCIDRCCVNMDGWQANMVIMHIHPILLTMDFFLFPSKHGSLNMFWMFGLTQSYFVAKMFSLIAFQNCSQC